MTPTQILNGLAIEAFRAEEGCLGYLIVDPGTGQALVVDPRLDRVDEIVSAAEARDATIRFVLDTHTHADHLSGVRRLASRTGATAVAHPSARLSFEADRLKDGQVLELGATRIHVIYSPGHTPDSLSLLTDGHLFTGDALFVGGAGRTDFPGGSSSALYDTFRRFEVLPEETVVHPGHDYVGQLTTTIGHERTGNSLMAERDRVALGVVLDVKGSPPLNMDSILTFNISGPEAATITPLELDALSKLDGAVVVVDVRSSGEFASERLERSTNIPLQELDGRVHEIPRGTELIVVCQAGVRAADGARLLRERGRDPRVLAGGLNAWRRSGLPVRGRQRLSVERQTQLTIGLLIVSSVLLGVLASPWFLAITAALGLGLTLAGLSGTCGLAVFLGKAPWNRLNLEPPTASPSCAVGGSSPTPSACSAGGTSSPRATRAVSGTSTSNQSSGKQT